MYRTFSYFKHHSTKLHYSEYGSGPHVLIMFHGFGQSIKNLRVLEETLGSEYKIYSFDLLFHGFSEWNQNDTSLTKTYWKEIFRRFLQENDIERFSLLGFSLGGKVAMVTFELFAAQIDKLMLLAPDGIHTNFWYKLATTSGPLRSVFKRTIMKPAIYQALIHYLSNMKLVDKGVLRFAQNQMNTREKRRRVYYTWIVMRPLKPNLKRIQSLLQQYNNKVEIFLGKYDRLISYQSTASFIHKTNASYYILNSGHNNLVEETANYLAQEISRK